MHRRNVLKWITAAAFTAPTMARAMTGHADHMAMPAPKGGPTLADPPAYTPFPAARHAALDTLVDLIIPADETRGAKDAGVTGFIEMIHQHWMTEDEQKRCDAELDLVLAAFALEGDPVPHLYDGARFKAPTLRKLTVYGYYTSEIGASEELDLNLVPGAYDACAAFDASQRAPSLNTWGVTMNLSTGAGA